MNAPVAQLSGGARVVAGAVIVAGAALLAVRLPAMHFDQPLLFLALLAASIVISVSKISLPIVGGTATLSMSYFTDLLAVMLVGADQAMLVAGTSAMTQCYALSRVRPPLVSIALQRRGSGRRRASRGRRDNRARWFSHHLAGA